MSRVTRSLWALGAACALLAAGCGARDGCGPGTHAVDGVCMALEEPIHCAEGARLDDAGVCVPVLQCGEGTRFDEILNTCTPTVRCAEGTVLDPESGECRGTVVCDPATTVLTPGDPNDPNSTATCEPRQVCGAFTLLTAIGECVPIDRCGEGTRFDASSGLCVPLLRCDARLVDYQGECLTPAEVVARDATDAEDLLANNDPVYGGVPQPLTLAPEGGARVFTGAIGRPVDIDGDGLPDQDRDAWAFTGAGGTVLHVRVLDDGLPEPVFLLSGPEGFWRSSQVGGALHADRRVILPHDGVYTLLIEPASARVSPIQIGGTTLGYVGVLEIEPWPAAQSVAIPEPPSTLTVVGRVQAWGDNVFSLEPAAIAALRMSATAEVTAAAPVLLVYSEAHAFLGEVDLVASDGLLRASQSTAVSADAVAIMIMDWRTTDSANPAYTVVVDRAPIEHLGTVGPGSTLTRLLPPLPPQGLTGFSVDASAGEVISHDVTGLTDTRVSVSGPRGLVEAAVPTSRADYDFLAVESGRYTWVVVNDGGGAASLDVAIAARPPLDAGTLAPGGAPVALSAEPITPHRRIAERVWVRVDVSAPGVVTAALDYEHGRPSFALFNARRAGGLQRHGIGNALAAGVQHAWLDEAGPVLARVSLSTTQPVPLVDWQVSLTATPAPTQAELEPNDLPQDATPIEGDFVIGALAVDEQDHFALTLPTPLVDDQALRISVQNLDGGFAPRLTVRNSMLQVMATRDDKTLGRTLTAWTLLAWDGAVLTGPYVLELTGTAGSAGRYLVHVEPRALAPEVEPNDSAGAAQDLGELADARLLCHGTTSGGAGGLDVFRFTLATPLPADEAILLRARMLASTTPSTNDDDLRVTLRVPASGDVVAQGEGEDLALLVSPSGTGPWLIEVRGESAGRTDQYRLALERLAPAELEPNDNVFTATPRGDLGGSGEVLAFGAAEYLATDFFRVGMPLLQPLGPLDGLVVAWQAQLGGVPLEVSVLDDSEAVLGRSRAPRGEVIVSPTTLATGPYFVRVWNPSVSATGRPETYAVSVRRSGAIADAEPNDDELVAQDLPPLPLTIRAQARGAGPSGPMDVDVYRVVLNAPVPAGYELRARASVVFSADPLTLVLRDAAFIELANSAGLDPEVRLPPPDGGVGATYYVELRASADGPEQWSVYTLDLDFIEVADPP